LELAHATKDENKTDVWIQFIWIIHRDLKNYNSAFGHSS
jgi:hypothetical protein